MDQKTKKFSKKLTAAAVASLLVLSIGSSSIIASAANLSADGRYYSDYTSQELAEQEAEEMNKELAEEGIVMLKNDGSLPISTGSKVSVLGVAQDCMVETSGSIAESLTAAGLTVNPTLEEFYSSDGLDYTSFGTETTLGTAQKQSIRLYNDVGVVVIARGSSGESSGRDTSTGEIDDNTYLGASTGWEHEAHSNDSTNDYKHELQLTESEEELIKLAEQYCDKVVVLYSASYTFEMANLQNDSKINGIYWIGRLGDGGVDAVGEILTGAINPSGKLVDEWTRDFTNDPTYANTSASTYYDENGNATSYSGIDYEEDIYIGYKYYETYWYEASQVNTKLSPSIAGQTDAVSADEWYNYNVVYPMGYGLSYTDFSFTLKSVYDNNGNELDKTLNASDISSSTGSAAKITTLYADVEVKNTGDYAGKDTVQVYITAPYTSGGIEKSYLTLVGYAKTDEIKPGGTDTVTVAFNVQDFASYDYSDANDDTHKGYEIETGEYTIHVMESSSHTNYDTAAYASQTFTVSGATNAHLDIDDYSGNEISNLFSNGDDFDSLALAESAGSMTTLLSRSDFDGTAPAAPTKDELTLSDDDIALLGKYADIDADTIDDSEYPWYVKSVPSGWTQATGVADSDGFYAITLDDMAGIALDDEAWVTFMNQLTWDEIGTILNDGFHRTTAVATIGKLESNDENGPNYTWADTTWVGAPTVAATWNTELCERYGIMIGNIALFQDMSGWYGPGVNIRRNQFNGRNPEYYSQDSIQGGYIAAAVISGVSSRGINVYVKHFAMYDSSTGHNGSANASEQNMRENYLRMFQMSFQEGGANAAMTSYNSIGYVYAGENYNLIQGLARDEWGWTGYTVTDSNTTNVTIDGLIRAGAELPDGDLSSNSAKALSGEWDAENNCVLVNGEASATQWYCARMSAMRILYNAANSAANHNGVTDSSSSETVKATQGVSFSQSVVPEKYMNEDAGYTVGYSIVSGELPAGLSIVDGVLTGTPTVSGTYELVIDITIDSWITMELDLTIEIASIIDMEMDISSLSTGDNVNCYVDFDDTTSDIVYTSYTYSIADGALPTGLSMDSDGKITGTATTAGTYTFTILVEAQDGEAWKPSAQYATFVQSFIAQYGSITGHVEYLYSQGMDSYVDLFYDDNPPTEYYFTYTITVTGSEVSTVVTVESVELDTNGDILITYTDGTTSTIEISTGTGATVSDYVTSVATDSNGNIVVTLSDGTSTTIEIADGKYVSGITSNGDGTITVTYSDNTTDTVTITDAEGSESSGCSGNIAANVATVAAMFGIFAAAVVVVRKKSKSKED